MYWAYTTMTTVGYGDIIGTTFAEKVYRPCGWPASTALPGAWVYPLLLAVVLWTLHLLCADSWLPS